MPDTLNKAKYAAVNEILKDVSRERGWKPCARYRAGRYATFRMFEHTDGRKTIICIRSLADSDTPTIVRIDTMQRPLSEYPISGDSINGMIDTVNGILDTIETMPDEE